MPTDDVLPHDLRTYRYVCYAIDCRYTSIPLSTRGVLLIRNVHRHRHAVGLAGIYNNPESL